MRLPESPLVEKYGQSGCIHGDTALTKFHTGATEEAEPHSGQARHACPIYGVFHQFGWNPPRYGHRAEEVVVKKILWMSRNEPLTSQVQALKGLYGKDARVVQDPDPFDTADTIISRFRAGKFDDMVVVAPLSVIQKLCEKGLNPLWAQMIESSEEESELMVRGIPYKFDRFKRVRKVTVEFFD